MKLKKLAFLGFLLIVSLFFTSSQANAATQLFFYGTPGSYQITPDSRSALSNIPGHLYLGNTYYSYGASFGIGPGGVLDSAPFYYQGAPGTPCTGGGCVTQVISTIQNNTNIANRESELDSISANILNFLNHWTTFCPSCQDGRDYISVAVGDMTAPASTTKVAWSDYYFVFYRNSGVITTDPPQSFYSQVKNTGGGYINLRNGSSTSAVILKTLPEDWVVFVASTTDNSNNPIYANGYRWYQVIDPTDNVSGWIAGQTASGTAEYLPYDLVNQSPFSTTSEDYIATSSRPDLIMDVVDHYYNNSSTTSSLYSSDDGSNNISDLKNNAFAEKVILGIAAQESGGVSFSNENVSYHNPDYGLGVMQISFVPGEWDNRGYASMIAILPCESTITSDYLDCFINSSPSGYKPYGGSGNITYKQYTNTEQSIYANIKDGMEILADKSAIYSSINASTTVSETTYGPEDRKIISTTESYNGSCGYVDDVANRLDSIDTYFPTATSSDIATLVTKMHTAGSTAICASLHSPAVLTIQDSKGNIAGVVNDRIENTFPLAVVNKEQKTVKILAAQDDNYRYKVVGIDNGVYGFDITFKDGKEFTQFHASGIPTKRGETHIYSVDKQALKEGRPDAIVIQVDSNGDGKIEKIIKAGPTLDAKHFIAQ